MLPKFVIRGTCANGAAEKLGAKCTPASNSGWGHVHGCREIRGPGLGSRGGRPRCVQQAVTGLDDAKGHQLGDLMC